MVNVQTVGSHTYRFTETDIKFLDITAFIKRLTNIAKQINNKFLTIDTWEEKVYIQGHVFIIYGTYWDS